MQDELSEIGSQIRAQRRRPRTGRQPPERSTRFALDATDLISPDAVSPIGDTKISFVV